jgi:hypothetical protein
LAEGTTAYEITDGRHCLGDNWSWRETAEAACALSEEFASGSEPRADDIAAVMGMEAADMGLDVGAAFEAHRAGQLPKTSEGDDFAYWAAFLARPSVPIRRFS